MTVKGVIVIGEGDSVTILLIFKLEKPAIKKK